MAHARAVPCGRHWHRKHCNNVTQLDFLYYRNHKEYGMNTLRTILLTACCLLLLAAGFSFAKDAKSIPLATPQGNINVPVNPARVVVMDFGMLDTLDALKAAGAIQHEVAVALPKANLPSYLSRYKAEGYVDVGGLKDFNLETIYAFKPDLIITSARQQDFYKELSSIAPVWQVNNMPADYVPGVAQNIRDMGAVFSAGSQVDKALEDIDAAILKVRHAAEEQNLKALILLTNDGKISAYGSGSRFGIIHDAMGIGQADPDIKVGLHGQMVNYEYIAAKDPDIIFVVDRSAAVSGKADGARILDNDLVNGTKAARNGRIIALDPNVWYLSGGGLQSLGMMVSEIQAALKK